MGKGKRKRERQERREGKGRLVDLAEERRKRRRDDEDRRAIASAAVASGPARARRPEDSLPAGAIDPRREEIEAATMEAWRAAGEPAQGAAA